MNRVQGMRIIGVRGWLVNIMRMITPGKFPIGMHGPRVRRAWLWASWPWWQALKMAYRACALAAIHGRQMALSSLFSLSTFHSGYLASRMDTGSSSCDGGSERHSFRERQPAESLQLGKKQAVLEHAEWTYRYTTYRWWVQRAIFRASVGGRQHSDNHGKILVTWHPTMAVKTLSTQKRTAGYLGLQSDKLQREWSVLSHTKLPKRGQNSSFASLVWKVVLRRRMCKFYTADFQNSTAKRKKNSLAKRSPSP